MTPRLFRHVLGIEAKSRLSYRAEFWLSALAGFAADFGVVWFLWVAVFETSGKEMIGGRKLRMIAVASKHRIYTTVNG